MFMGRSAFPQVLMRFRLTAIRAPSVLCHPERRRSGWDGKSKDPYSLGLLLHRFGEFSQGSFSAGCVWIAQKSKQI